MTVASRARSEAAWLWPSVLSSPAGRCGGGAEERQGGRGTGRAAGGGGRTSCTFPSCLSHSDSTEVRRAEAGNKGAEWGGERIRRRGAPGRLPEDPGRRKPKCHLNSTQEAGAWDLSALFSNNCWSASYKLRESPPERRTITCSPAPLLQAPRDPSIASRWKGSSRMKSKKGKAPGLSRGGS